MTTMPYEDFSNPSEISGGGSAHPSFAQLKDRLVWIYPTAVEHGVTTPLKTKPHTKVTCDLAFFSGPPIDRVLRKDGSVGTMLTPPVQPGQVMVGRWVNQDWFVNRLKDKVGIPRFPGVVGVVSEGRGKTGNMFYQLSDPTPEQMAQVSAWFAWKNQQAPGAVNYVPAPPVQTPPGVVPSAMAGQSFAAAPGGSPFAQPAAQYAQAPGGIVGTPGAPFQQTPANMAPGVQTAPTAPAQGMAVSQPVGPWQPTLPPGVQQAPAAAPAAPAPQPGPDVPPWQR